MEDQVNRVHKVPLVWLASLGLKDHPVFQEMLVLLVDLAIKDLLDATEKMVLMETQDPLVLQAIVESLVKMAFLVFPDQWEKRVRQGAQDLQDYLVTKDLQENKEILDFLDLKVQEVGQVLQVLSVH